MEIGLTIEIVDPDDDYLGIEIRAANDRFAGSARIYAGLDELSDFATQLAGFPTSGQDGRVYEFGSRDPSAAGGYSKLRFHCVDQAGHAAVDIDVEDDNRGDPPGSVRLSIPVEAAGIDRFITRLREIERDRAGKAALSVA
jgi:hypothetical protein